MFSRVGESGQLTVKHIQRVDLGFDSTCCQSYLNELGVYL